MASKTVARSSPNGLNNKSSQKAKRKEQHPVRKEFVEVGPNRFRCVHCDWSTVLNATRMIKHIIEVCENSPDELKREMIALQQAAAEKEQNSSMISENKKDIHGLFNIVENNKRSCMFCEWSTVRNLTRMRTHIVMHCPKVPEKVRSCFLKDEYKESSLNETSGGQEETYQVFEIDEQERGWEESTTVELVNEEDKDDEDKHHDETEQNEDSTEFNYVEVQELEERQCSWCGSVLAYDSCEVEDGSEVYCSSECFKNHTESMRKQVKRVPLKRPAPTAESPPKPKKIQVVMVTSTAPNPKTTTVTLKKEPEADSIRTTRKPNPPPPQEEEEEEEEEDFPEYSVEEEEPEEPLPPPPPVKVPQRKVVVAAPELKSQKHQQQQQQQQQLNRKVLQAATTRKSGQSNAAPAVAPASTASTVSKVTGKTDKAVPEKKVRYFESFV